MANRSRHSSSSKRSSYKSKKGRSSKGSTNKVLIFIAVILIGVIAYAGYYYTQNIKPLYENEVVEGVSFAGEDISGMTEEELKDIVSKSFEEEISKVAITIKHDDAEWVLTAEDLNVSMDSNAIVQEILALGHEGTVSERMDMATRAESGDYDFGMSTAIDLDTLKGHILSIKTELDTPAVNGSMVFDVSGFDYFADDADPYTMFIITKGTEGLEINLEDTLAEIIDGLEHGNTVTVDLTFEHVIPTQTELSSASIPDNIVVLDTIDEEYLRSLVTEIFHSSTHISSGNSLLDSRNENIELSLSHFRGRIVAPGETLSWDDIVGERTPEAGYQQAPTIKNDKTLVDDYGGGVCQASTTLFNALLLAGADVIDRDHHSWPLYASDYDDQYSRDAMINWGTSNLVMTNNTEHPMFLNFYFWYNQYGTPRYVDVDIYTRPLDDGKYYEIDSVIEESNPPEEPQFIPDEDGEFADMEVYDWEIDEELGLMVFEKVTPRTEYFVKVYRLIMQDGNELSRTELYLDHFKSVQGIYYTMPIPEELLPTAEPTLEPTIAPDPTPEP